MRHEKTNSLYRPEIDGLRAIAVISVIANHFSKESLPNGNLGVDIFFVISGFVISSSLLGQTTTSLFGFLRDFYSRRIKRLAPALLLFTLIIGPIVCLFNPQPSVSIKTGVLALFGLSNIYLLHQSIDYFAPSTELNAFTHTWSLGVEEQFYLLFPLLVWFTRFTASSRLRNNRENYFLLIISALSLASLIYFLFLSRTNPYSAFFLMPTRFWELGVGGILLMPQLIKRHQPHI